MRFRLKWFYRLLLGLLLWLGGVACYISEYAGRDEMKMDSLEALKAQIALDAAQARSVLS